MTPTVVTTNSFQDEVLDSDIPVLVDFWAEWCGPCRAISPMIDSISLERGGQVKVVKVNIDNYPDLAVKYEVSSIPNLAIFKDGELSDRMVGVSSKRDLDAFIDSSV